MSIIEKAAQWAASNPAVQSRGLNLSRSTIKGVWSAITQFIETEMLIGKGVNVIGLGVFTFHCERLDCGTLGKRAQRKPVFLLSDLFARSFAVSSPKPVVSGNTPITMICFSRIAAQVGITRQAVQCALKDILRFFGERANHTHSRSGLVLDCRVCTLSLSPHSAMGSRSLLCKWNPSFTERIVSADMQNMPAAMRDNDVCRQIAYATKARDVLHSLVANGSLIGLSRPQTPTSLAQKTSPAPQPPNQRPQSANGRSRPSSACSQRSTSSARGQSPRSSSVTPRRPASAMQRPNHRRSSSRPASPAPATTYRHSAAVERPQSAPSQRSEPGSPHNSRPVTPPTNDCVGNAGHSHKQYLGSTVTLGTFTNNAQQTETNPMTEADDGQPHDDSAAVNTSQENYGGVFIGHNSARKSDGWRGTFHPFNAESRIDDPTSASRAVEHQSGRNSTMHQLKSSWEAQLAEKRRRSELERAAEVEEQRLAQAVIRRAEIEEREQQQQRRMREVDTARFNQTLSRRNSFSNTPRPMTPTQQNNQSLDGRGVVDDAYNGWSPQNLSSDRQKYAESLRRQIDEKLQRQMEEQSQQKAEEERIASLIAQQIDNEKIEERKDRESKKRLQAEMLLRQIQEKEAISNPPTNRQPSMQSNAPVANETNVAHVNGDESDGWTADVREHLRLDSRQRTAAKQLQQDQLRQARMKQERMETARRIALESELEEQRLEEQRLAEERAEEQRIAEQKRVLIQRALSSQIAEKQRQRTEARNAELNTEPFATSITFMPKPQVLE